MAGAQAEQPGDLVWRSELTPSTSSVNRRGKYHSAALGASAPKAAAKRSMGVSSPFLHRRGLPVLASEPALMRISSRPLGEVSPSNA